MKTEFEYFIFFFRLLSLFLSLIYFILLLFFKKLDIINEITLIKNNFQASPIYSISQSLTGKCNENESIYKLGYFPGILKGRFYKKRVYVGKCNKFHSSKCKTINKIDGFDLNKWDGNTFCVNTNSELNYETFIRNSVENNNECDIGFKKCGFLDSNNRIMCIEENNDCPINKIIINNNEISPNDYNYKTIPLNNNKYLHYTNESINNAIIVNFTISSGIPCSDPNEINTKYPQYILDGNFLRYICSKKINGKLNDNNYNFIDSINKSVLYNENEIYQHFFSLYDYPFYSLNENIELYTRNYFGMDVKYFENKNFYTINKLNQTFDYNSQYNKIIKIIFYYSCVLYCSTLIHSHIGICRNTCKCVRIFNIFLIFLIILLWNFISVLSISCYSLLKNYNLLNFGFDENRNFSLKHHMKVLKRNKSLLITIITFSILYFAEMVFVLIYIKRKIKKQTINRNEDFRIQLRRID